MANFLPPSISLPLGNSSNGNNNGDNHFHQQVHQFQSHQSLLANNHGNLAPNSNNSYGSAMNMKMSSDQSVVEHDQIGLSVSNHMFAPSPTSPSHLFSPSQNGNSASLTASLILGENYRDIAGVRLFLGDLSYFCTEADLLNHFSSYGPINHIHIRRGVRKNSLMHGFIILQSPDLAYRAISDYHQKEFMGRNMT
jgi:hypothetical protein